MCKHVEIVKNHSYSETVNEQSVYVCIEGKKVTETEGRSLMVFILDNILFLMSSK